MAKPHGTGDLALFLGTGVALQILGTTMWLLAWPGTEPGNCSVDSETLRNSCEQVPTGNEFATVAGVGISGVGTLMTLIAVIGFGVFLGHRAYGSSRA